MEHRICLLTLLALVTSTGCNWHTASEAEAGGELQMLRGSGETITLLDQYGGSDDTRTVMCATPSSPYSGDLLFAISDVAGDAAFRFAVEQGANAPIAAFELEGRILAENEAGQCVLELNSYRSRKGDGELTIDCDVVDLETGEAMTLTGSIHYDGCVRDREILVNGVVDIGEFLVELARNPEDAAGLAVLVAYAAAGGSGRLGGH